jgi:hypothetical protein
MSLSKKKCDYRWNAVETMEGLQVFVTCLTHGQKSSWTHETCRENMKVDAVVASVLGHMDLHTKYPRLEEDQL